MPRTASYALAGLAALAAVAAFVLYGQGNNLGFLLAGIAAGWSLAGAALIWDRRLGVFVAALLALGVSLYLGQQHLDAQGGAICSVDEVFNCDLVNQSKYSEVRGVPIALLGAAFYAGTALVALLARPGKPSFANAPHLVALGGALSVLYSVFLAWASSQVGAWCLFCISLYGLNALLLVGGLVWVNESGIPLGQGVRAVLFAKHEKSLTVLGLVLVAGVILGRQVNKPTAGGADGSGAGAPQAGLTVYRVDGEVPLDGTEPVFGSPSAKITVVEFADYECPHCGVVAPELHDLVLAAPDVRLLFKNYPLDNACNPNIGRVFHKNACAAAVAAECARQQGRFWELNRLLFKNADALDPDGIAFMAGQVGLDMATFDACRAAPSSVEAVVQDIAHATAVNVGGTPTIFVNGLYGDQWVLVRGPGDLAELLKLASKGKALPTPVPRLPDE